MHDRQDGSKCPGEDCACRPDPAEDTSPVIQALCRAARLHHQFAWQLLRAAGLHPGQELIMMRLWADGPQQPAALIRLLGSDAATMTRSVQRLERAGFVRRKPSPTDRRAVIIEPTQASQALRSQVEAIWPRLEELCTRGFTDGERAQATELLSMIERNLARAADEEGQGEEPSLRLATGACGSFQLVQSITSFIGGRARASAAALRGTTAEVTSAGLKPAATRSRTRGIGGRAWALPVCRVQQRVYINHPFRENLWHREAGLEPDYFATYSYTVEWTVGGQSAVLRFWTRPLHAMTGAFTAAGFRISVISEPAVAPDTPRELLPDDISDSGRFLCFLFFVLQAD